MNIKNKITTVIFDLDGTLLDTLADLSGSVNYALAQSGMPARSPREVRRFLGNGIRQLMRCSVPEGTAEEAYEKAFHAFRSHYMVHCLDETRPYEGVMPMLATLREKGFRLAIVSNKLQPAVTELNERFFSDCVEVAIGESKEVKRKPAPDTVVMAMKRLGSSAEESIYVGDSEVDLATARNSGLPCISVLWGFRDRDFLEEHEAKLLAESPAEIVRMLCED